MKKKNSYRLAIIVFLAQAGVASSFISKYYDCIQEFLLSYTYTDFVSERLLPVVKNNHSRAFEKNHRGSFSAVMQRFTDFYLVGQRALL